MKDIEGIKNRLKQARRDAGLTQQELAIMAGTSQDVINKIETGKSLRPRIIDKLAEVLGKSPAWLQFGDDSIDSLSEEAIELALTWDKLDDEQKEHIQHTIELFSRQTKD